MLQRASRRKRTALLTTAWLPVLLGAVPVALGAGPERAVSLPAAADRAAPELFAAEPAAPEPTGVERAAPADVASALRSLSPLVVESSDAGALETALRAYYSHRTEHPTEVRKPYLYFVDLGLGPRTPRGWVFDMDELELVEGPFTVAHGSGSSATRDAVPTVFSNAPGSNASSLGLYVTRGTYAFRGKAGGRPYTSVGLRLRGESGRFNDAALTRGIVVHGAPYVTASAAGRSQGCPAMELERAERLLPLIAGGSVVFIYSPRDERWLSEGPWLRAAEQ